ncbi:hypothetical protein CWR45_14155 [Oceanobacillus chungangensis]|uniref:Uncharacterized protein n=1 Tax=Oceanobacillus chungangensis TaxID=1229152 RepID=A0A3D8PNE7_9BACI|nr:hypothetical protein CWR45_14155 [Oceanobacillus chungangensis]
MSLQPFLFLRTRKASTALLRTMKIVFIFDESPAATVNRHERVILLYPLNEEVRKDKSNERTIPAEEIHGDSCGRKGLGETPKCDSTRRLTSRPRKA